MRNTVKNLRCRTSIELSETGTLKRGSWANRTLCEPHDEVAQGLVVHGAALHRLSICRERMSPRYRSDPAQEQDLTDGLLNM